MSRYRNLGIFSPERKCTPIASLEDELIEFGTSDLSDVQDDVIYLNDDSNVIEENIESTEGFKEQVDMAFNYLAQGPVLRVKHIVNGLDNLITSTNQQIEKYDAKLQMTQQEYNEKRQHFSGDEHVVALNELWYFFRRKNGPTVNLIRDLDSDTDFSRYALSEFPKQMLREMGKFEQLIKKLNTSKGSEVADQVIQDVAKVKSAADIFENKYLGNEKYFDVVSIVVKDGDIVEQKSKLHRLDKVVANAFPGSGQNLDVTKIELSTADIQKIIDGGFEYLKAIRAYKDQLEDFLKLYNGILNAAREVGRSSNKDNAGKAVAEVMTKATDFKRTINKLCNKELIRSLKGARYCYYIALRAIYNATKYIK